MQLVFANPLGFWALLMLPALVLIHSLHINRQPRIITTLFLVRSKTSERRGGRTFVFWKHSVTFWLQVLCALLLTWLLLQPRWIGAQTSQRIAWVLDSSLSMDAFKEAMLEQLRRESRSLAQSAAHTHWLLTDSQPRPQVLYSGSNLEDMLRAAAQWQPALGTHDWEPAINTARTLLGNAAAVIFVTDHPPAQRPHKMHVLGIGTALPNAGFTGLQISQNAGETTWRTLLKNYSDHPVQRQWWIEIDGERLPPKEARLPADGSLLLSGTVPAGVKAMTLVLDDDLFAADNRLPLVLPQPKQLHFSIEAQSQKDALQTLLLSLPNLVEAKADTQPDLLVTQFASLHETDATTEKQGRTATDSPARIFFARPDSATTTLADESSTTDTSLAGESASANSAAANESPAADTARRVPQGVISATLHPLNDGLNWNSLSPYADVHPHTLAADETPLLWLGSTPLIWLKGNAGDLIFNLSPQTSNLLHLPATVLLINRHVEQLRRNKPLFEALNVELGEPLRISLPAGAGRLNFNGETIEAVSNPLFLQAPTRPAHFSLQAGSAALLEGAAHFADVREADLRNAASTSDLKQLKAELIETNSEADAFEAWWLLLLAAALLASWHYAERGR